MQPTESFRVPNSIVQGVTTTTTADLNRLTAFEMVTLLGLLAIVDQKQPEREVRTSVSAILKIIEVSKLVSHAVGEQDVARGMERQNPTYSRFHPAHVKLINKALLALHEKSVVIRRRDPKTNNRIDNRTVHILEMFGYSYAYEGKTLDPDNLPADSERVNVGSDERPVWKVRRKADGDRYDRPTGILFRLNTELADELSQKRGTIGFTLLAHKVFNILKDNMSNPATIRLILLVLRQTGTSFSRKLGQTLIDLGWDPTHPTRATNQLRKALSGLKESSIVQDFVVEPDKDHLRIDVNRTWYLEEEAMAMGP